MILEDDVTFASSLPRLTRFVVSQLQSISWDFVFFGHEMTGNISRANGTTGEKELKFEVWSQHVMCAHFYGVHHRVLPRLVDHLERIKDGPEGDPMFGPMPIDGALSVFRATNPDVRSYIVHPKLAWQRSFRSDISPGAIDKLLPLRPLIATLRDLKHLASLWRS